MIRGTTPTLKFKFKKAFDFGVIDNVWVTFRDSLNKSIVLNKTMDDVELDADNNAVLLTLSQKDALSFIHSVDAQLKIHCVDGSVFATIPASVNVSEIFNAQIIGGAE